MPTLDIARNLPRSVGEMLESDTKHLPLAASRRVSPSVATPVFRLDEQESQPHNGGAQCSELDTHDIEQQIDTVMRILRPPSRQLEKLCKDVERYLQRSAEEGEDKDLVDLAVCLDRVGYEVAFQNARGGGSGHACFENLNHQCMIVYMDGDSEETPVVIDIAFREQFSVAHPSPVYAALLEVVPSCFVGTLGQLLPLVRLLCSQMQKSFLCRAGNCPPWRQQRSLLSKWIPKQNNKKDETLEERLRRLPWTPSMVTQLLPAGECGGMSPTSSSGQARRLCCGASPDSIVGDDGRPCRHCKEKSLMEPSVKMSGFDVSDERSKNAQAMQAAQRQQVTTTPATSCNAPMQHASRTPMATPPSSAKAATRPQPVPRPAVRRPPPAAVSPPGDILDANVSPTPAPTSSGLRSPSIAIPISSSGSRTFRPPVSVFAAPAHAPRTPPRARGDGGPGCSGDTVGRCRPVPRKPSGKLHGEVLRSRGVAVANR